MKIKRLSNNNNKLLKLKILQTKIYSKEQYLNNIKIEEIEYRLKKISHIIYRYDTSNKTILFIGMPFDLPKIKRLSKNNKHIFLPTNIWASGAIYNKKLSFKHMSKQKSYATNKISKLIFQLKKSIDLIVIFDEAYHFDVINESYLTKIPAVTLGSNLNVLFEKPSYKVPGNFKFVDKKIDILNKMHNYFLYSMLVAVLGRNQKI